MAANGLQTAAVASTAALWENGAARWIAALAPWDLGASITICGGTPRSPLVSSGAQTSVVFDGSLYNRTDLARQLAVASAVGDAALVRAGYERWGVDVVRHLKGVFALCVADATQGRLVIARDPLGAYPVFYAEAKGRLLVSTSLHTLREQPGVNRAFNREVIADHISHRWCEPHETFFAAIRRLMAGHFLVSSGDGYRATRYWDPVPDSGPVDWVSTDCVQDEFEKRFGHAVERALDPGPAAIFLSGGLDSISVAAMATDTLRRAGRSVPYAVSLGFPGEDSEEPEQRGVAKSLGLELEIVPFYEAVPGPILEATLAHMRDQPAPLLNPWTPAYFELARRAARRGARVILTGNGGDEWLAVSPYLAADLIRNLDVGGLLGLYRSYRRSYDLSASLTMRNIFWRFGMRPIGSSLLDRAAPRTWNARRVRRSVRALKPWLAPDPSLRANVVARVGRSLLQANPPRGFYFRDIRQMIEHPLVAMEQEEMFEVGRRLGFRYGNPYWDGDVADILYRTPPRLLLAGGRSKGIVRATMARRFSGLGLDRQRKRGATGFFTSIVARQVPELWRRNCELPALSALGIVDAQRARRMADRAIEKREMRDLVGAWYLMNTEAWVATHA